MADIVVIDTMADHRSTAALLFADLARHSPQFHPHPLTEAFAQEHTWIDDVYAIMFLRTGCMEVGLAYGMLRGWDAGYVTPSLGIAVASGRRGLGLGRMMMHYLHATAAIRGAEFVRLRVYPDNLAAVRLYESLGYTWEPGLEDGQRVGLAKVLRCAGR